MESRLTIEEKVDKSYRDKRGHEECKKAVYSKGREYFQKLYPDDQLFGEQDEQHFYYFDYGMSDQYVLNVACDNCVELWKRDEKISKTN
jgi:hypothetical protein